MSNKALDLLIDAGLLTSSGKAINISSLSPEEVSSRISQYVMNRKKTVILEIDTFQLNNSLSALFSTGLSKNANDKSLYNKLLSSTLVYDSIVIDDPLVSSFSSISFNSSGIDNNSTQFIKNLNLFAWSFKLIRSGFIKILPISFFNNPSSEIPILCSDDAFRSSIPSQIHDFSHKNAILKSVIKNDSNEMLVLPEEAYISKRKALKVGFKDDYRFSGNNLYMYFSITELEEQANGSLQFCSEWNSKETLNEEEFNNWAYQSINQTIRSRLSNIYNETYLATTLGHTYVTESKFESDLLAMSGIENHSEDHNAVKFLELNNDFFNIESPEQIIELRTKYSSAFEQFNCSIREVTEELSGLNKNEFEQKSKTLLDKEIRPQINEIRDNIQSISSGITKGFLVSLGGISLAIATGTAIPFISALMFSVAGGLTEALPSVSTYENKKKRPEYIWHRITKT